jgi:hypothetical protein
MQTVVVRSATEPAFREGMASCSTAETFCIDIYDFVDLATPSTLSLRSRWETAQDAWHVTATHYRSRAKDCIILQYLQLVFTIFEVLEGPIHGGNELETSNCN